MTSNAFVQTKYGVVTVGLTLEARQEEQRLFVQKFGELSGLYWGRGFRYYNMSLRKARLKASDFHISDAEFEEKCWLLGYKCFWCGKITHSLTRDHLVELFKGGTDEASNIVPSCIGCNASRDWTLEERIKSKSKRSKETQMRWWILTHPDKAKRVINEAQEELKKE